MRRSKLALSLMTMLSLVGCVAESRDPGQATGDDPLEYVDDLPADSASGRCADVDAALARVEARFQDDNGLTFEPDFAPTVRLIVLETEWDEIVAEEAAYEISYFTADHAYSNFERMHTLHSRSCSSGAIIGEFTDHGKTYRVTIQLKQDTPSSEFTVRYFSLEETIAWEDQEF